jgi:hypothetical protein
MRQIAARSLWLGHRGDVRDLRAVLSAGIVALVDLALDEPLPIVTRDLVYCRFPLVDGAGNPTWLLRTALLTTAELLRADAPTLICCSAGLSRSPALAAAAVSLVTGQPPHECLIEVVRSGPSDVTPLLWRDLKDVLLACASQPNS